MAPGSDSTAHQRAVTRFVNEGFFRLIANVTGVVAYYGIETGEDSWAAVGGFEMAAGAEESNRVAEKFVRDNPDLARLLKAPPEAR